MSQNVPLSKRDRIHIEKIKRMLLENKTQLDMSRELKLNRRTIYRKLQKWVLTSDFELWLKTAWLDKYQKVDDRTAFDALTKLLGKMVIQKREIKQDIDIDEKQEVRFTLDRLSPEEREFAKSIARKYIQTSNKGRPASIH